MIREGVGIISAATLADYHRHGRFMQDGIFSDNKIPLQYHFSSEQLQDVVDDAKYGYDLAKLAYGPKTTEQFELLLDKSGNPCRITDSTGLDAAAYRDKSNGKVVISIAGVEIKNTDLLTDTLPDMHGALEATAGAASSSIPSLLKFAQDVESEHGKISTISGHSLGGYQGMQLKIIADKQGLTTDGCKLFTYDIPGMTHTLANEMGEKYGITQAEISKSLYNENVTTVINDFNSFNTLGSLPGKILTATDPFKTNYKEYAVDHLVTKNHLLGDFDKSFSEGNWFEGNNYGHARGPEYITAFTTAGAAGTINPLGYIAAAQPVLRHAQGALGSLGGEYKHLLQANDPHVTDGLRPKVGEAPKMYAYKHLNDFYMSEFNSNYSSLTAGTQDEKLGQADKLARDPARLEAAIDKVISNYENRGTLDKTLDGIGYGVKWVGGWITDNEEIAELANSQEKLQYQNAIAAKAELPIYKQDYESSERKEVNTEQKIEEEKRSTSLNGIEIRDIATNEAITHNLHGSVNPNINIDPARTV